METYLTTQAKKFATYVADTTGKPLRNGIVTIRQALRKTMTALESSDMFDKTDSSSKKDDLIALN